MNKLIREFNKISNKEMEINNNKICVYQGCRNKVKKFVFIKWIGKKVYLCNKHYAEEILK